MAQTVKRLSTMQETWVQSLHWEDPLEKEMAICWEPAWRIPPMAKVMRKRPDGQRRDQDSRDPLDLLEHLPPNQNLSYYFMSFTNSSDINRGLSLTTFLWKELT